MTSLPKYLQGSIQNFSRCLCNTHFRCGTFLTGILSLKNKTARDFFEGKSTVLIKDGKILEDNLKKEKYTSDELLELLRGKSAFSVAEVEFAVLEPSGELNVLLKKDSQPLTAKDIGLKVPNEKEPQTVIMDGNVLDEPLSASGHNRAWLHSELEKSVLLLKMSSSVKWIHTDNLLSTFTMTNSKCLLLKINLYY